MIQSETSCDSSRLASPPAPAGRKRNLDHRQPKPASLRPPDPKARHRSNWPPAANSKPLGRWLAPDEPPWSGQSKRSYAGAAMASSGISACGLELRDPERTAGECLHDGPGRQRRTGDERRCTRPPPNCWK